MIVADAQVKNRNVSEAFDWLEKNSNGKAVSVDAR